MARLKRGDVEGGNADIAQARAVRPNIAGEQAQRGVR
jgi:hypothetical protein